MSNPAMPVCYHPTTVVFLDDNRKYLRELRLSLDEKKFAPRFFNDPQEALKFLKQYIPHPFVERCLTKPEETQLDHRSIDVDVPAIREEIYNPKRFAEISVLVIDYAMPNLNGLDICQELTNKPFKKILLTGEADEIIAVKAFNAKLIDKFIRKDTINFSETLNEAIQDLQHQYFQNLSNIVINSLNANPDFSDVTWVNDFAFLNLFKQITAEHHISEFYLMDTYGSYMLFDIDGNPQWLAVKDEDGMQGTYEVAEGSDKPFSSEMLKEIEKREKILFLYEGGFTEDPDIFKKHFYPVKKLTGKSLYYYALVQNPDTYNINRNKIASYRDYLEKIK
jgi:CheY-like chemotaxis protein